MTAIRSCHFCSLLLGKKYGGALGVQSRIITVAFACLTFERLLMRRDASSARVAGCRVAITCRGASAQPRYAGLV